MKYRIFVPVRLGSNRLPNKPLIEINGKTVIQRCLEQCPVRPILICPMGDAAAIMRGIDRSVKFDLVCNQPDDEKNIYCGTDRIAMSIGQHPNLMEGVDIAINLQGDNVLYSQGIFAQLAEFHKKIEERMEDELRPFISTVVAPLNDIHRGSVIAIMGEEDNIITFFRATTDGGHSFPDNYFLHRGVYCYSPEALQRWRLLHRTQIEQQENLEQMRWIAHGLPIYAMIDDSSWLDINTIADVEYARRGDENRHH